MTKTHHLSIIGYNTSLSEKHCIHSFINLFKIREKVKNEEVKPSKICHSVHATQLSTRHLCVVFVCYTGNLASTLLACLHCVRRG